MRILVTTPYFFPHTGGSQKYILEQYKSLRKLHPEIEVDVVCYNTDNAPAYEQIDGLHIYRVDCLEILPGQFALPNYWQLFQLLKTLKQQHVYAFINAHTRFFDNAWWTPLVATWFNIPAVLTDHCASHPVHSNAVVQMLVTIIDQLCIKIATQLYASVLTVSYATKKFLEQHGGKQSQVVYLGMEKIDTPSVNSALNWVKNVKDAQKEDKTVVTFLGRLIPHKHPELVLQIAEQIQNHDLLFVIAGSGPLEEMLRSTNHPQVLLTGNLSPSESQWLLQHTDILLHPSTHHEGLPLTLLEAGLAGCAIIATPQGGTDEIVENGKTGLLADLSVKTFIQHINTLVNDRKKLKTLGGNAQKLVQEKFAKQKNAELFYQTIQALSAK